jgi:multicomponent Na+:H+ antiporter subunit G
MEYIDFGLIKEVISCMFILTGVLLMLISTIGLLRLPDFYIRISAITKGSTMGVGLILLGIAIYFNQPSILLKVLAIISFTIVTAPVAAHVIARTAVQNKVPFWDKTDLKEFKKYQHREHLEQAITRDRYIMQELKKKKNAVPRGGDTEQKA